MHPAASSLGSLPAKTLAQRQGQQLVPSSMGFVLARDMQLEGEVPSWQDGHSCTGAVWKASACLSKGGRR